MNQLFKRICIVGLATISAYLCGACNSGIIGDVVPGVQIHYLNEDIRTNNGFYSIEEIGLTDTVTCRNAQFWNPDGGFVYVKARVDFQDWHIRNYSEISFQEPKEFGSVLLTLNVSGSEDASNESKQCVDMMNYINEGKLGWDGTSRNVKGDVWLIYRIEHNSIEIVQGLIKQEAGNQKRLSSPPVLVETLAPGLFQEEHFWVSMSYELGCLYSELTVKDNLEIVRL